jgi:hypothetical protein
MNKRSDFILDYLIKETEHNIHKLEQRKNILNAINTDDAKFEITIYSENTVANDLLYEAYSGSIAGVIKAAEKEFKTLNEGNQVRVDLFSVHLYVGKEKQFIPEEFWSEYRTL